MHLIRYTFVKMLVLLVLVLRTLCAISQVAGNAKPEKRFPDSFLLGASTSAFQIEGGWNADGKGESMWDYYLHNQPDIVDDLNNGDITADSYHLYERDVEILKHLGAKSYRFSISWTRILPDGTTKYINPHGIAYYRRLIDLLLANDILPLVTIYHWDLPISISDEGGWLNENTANKFGEYARVVFHVFGDKVKHWVTVNEPCIHCSFIYEFGLHPPLTKSPGRGFYECGRNLLLAHARAYHIYETEFKEVQGGQVGIVLDAVWPLAAGDSKDDAEAVKDYLAFHFGQYMDPIFKGGYPQRLINRIAAASERQGFPSSRLRPFSEQQKAFINGTADFVGINHYYSLYVYRNESVRGMYEQPSFEHDSDLGYYPGPSWPQSAATRMREYAPGFYNLLMYLKHTYDNPVIYITETGFPTTPAEGLNDYKKADYLRHYLKALLTAKEAGSNCRGYFFWSLLDGLEWASGYKYRFGLYQVNFTDASLRRIPRKSALVYKEIIRTGTIDFAYNPDPQNKNPAC